MQLKNTFLTSLFITALAFSTQAQSADEAFTFSQENNSGTARFKGLGNAKTALGGDISSITGNPAGLGFFGQSDISISANYNNANNQGSYFGSKTSRSKGKGGIDHAGVVFHFQANEGYQGWQNFNVGISYENTNTFTNNVRYEGINPDNTIVSSYADDILDFNDNVLAGDLSRMKLIEYFRDPDMGYFPIPNEMSDKTQISDILTKGQNSRTAFAFGANYNNKFYIGATVGFSFFRYENSDQFTESGGTKNRQAVLADNSNSNFVDPTHPDYKYLDVDYNLFTEYFMTSEGSGVDFKIGAIYKPTVDWNIGITINTPTWYTVDRYAEEYIGVDYYEPQETVTFDSPNVLYKEPDYTYRIITPWKFSFGLSKFFNRGLLTADAEYINYGNTKRRTTDDFGSPIESEWDQSMKDNYKAVANLRIGGEYLFTNILSGRAGFNYFGNPYKNADNKQYSGSLGLGAKLSQSLYLDLAVVHLINDYKVSRYFIYEDFWNSTSPVADIKHQRTNVVLTFGAKF